MDCWREIRRTGLPSVHERQGLRVQGWSVEEPGYLREFLRTVAVSEDWEI
ncbi:MAG: hypothetical protein O3A00_06640 [Planctomycetota bacterium]|nr:hypothetical protein [Planctomycetota bacterium]